MNLLNARLIQAMKRRRLKWGKKADAVISTWEPWNERTLEAVKDKVQYIVRYGGRNRQY